MYIVILLMIMIPMDILAVSQGIWRFSGKGVLGIYLFKLPIEEYLFVLVVPYFMLMVYKSLHIVFKK